MSQDFHNDDTFNVLDSLSIVIKYKMAIAIVTLCVALAAALVGVLLPKKYEATTKILPTQQNQNVMASLLSQMGGSGLASLAGGLAGTTTVSDLYSAMIQTDTIYDAVIDKFDLIRLTQMKYREDVRNILKKSITVDNGKEGIISITVVSRDPQRSADMANFIVQQVNDLSVKLNSLQSGQNRQFLEERLVKAKADLVLAEDKLKEFQAKNKILNVPDQARVSIEGIAQLTAQLAAQEVQLATLQRQFTDSSQDVRNIKASIARLKSQIARFEGGGVAAAIPSIGSVPAIGQEYVRLMREFKTQESIVGLLINQYELAKLGEASQNSTIQVLQQAKKPERKSKPKVKQLVIVISFASFFLGIIAAFIVERFKRMPEEDYAEWRQLKDDLLTFRSKKPLQ